MADKDIGIDAGNHLTIASAQSTETGNSNATSRSSGSTGSFWRPAVGRASSSEQAKHASTTQVGSTVASLDGNMRLSAGGTYTQTASDVLALGTGTDGKAGNIDITARNVVINEAYDTRNSAQQTEAKSLTLDEEARAHRHTDAIDSPWSRRTSSAGTRPCMCCWGLQRRMRPSAWTLPRASIHKRKV